MFGAQGLTVIFSHHQLVCVKKKTGGHFFGAKSESRVSALFFGAPFFSLRKWFSLWSSHKINANINVFLLIDWFTLE
jgi:hypothetical protein